MKRNALFLIIALIVSIIAITVGFIIIQDLGKNDIDYDQANNLWEQQIILIDNYIGGVEGSTKPEVTANAMNKFARGLEVLIPELNKLFAKYPAFLEKIKKENEEKSVLSQETQKKQEIMLKLIAAGLFTESLVKMKEGQLKAIPQLDTAQKKLLAAFEKLKLDNSLKTGTGVVNIYDKFVQGEITGNANANPQVEKFFEKLRRAGITSRLKITMRNMYTLGMAIESFKSEYSYVPDVVDVDQLKTYGDFVSKYLSRYIKPGQHLPLDDGWGNYFYYKSDNQDYWIGSGGSDGYFSGFEQKGVYTNLERSDVIYSNGKFIYLPQL